MLGSGQLLLDRVVFGGRDPGGTPDIMELVAMMGTQLAAILCFH